jgi:hypothetical protein
MRSRLPLILTLALSLGFGALPAQAASNFTTTVTQAGGEDWNDRIWEPGFVTPTAGNTYELLANGTSFGNGRANTRVRSPDVAGLLTFPGASLTLNTNTELRAKGVGAILNFPGTSTNAGLILKGGVLNAGDDAIFVITGKVQVASTSYIVPGDNGAGPVRPARGFKLAGPLSGSGSLVIYQAGVAIAQEVSGTSNTFTGAWVVKSGWLRGSAVGSLGTGNLTIDPLAAVTVDASVTSAEGPALLQIDYPIVTTNKLTLQNGGMLVLDQDLTFGSVTIEGTSLTRGSHSYPELAAAFPKNIVPAGSGSITVGGAAPDFTTKVVQASGENWNARIWEPGPITPMAGATFELVSNGTAFGNNLGNTRVRNPALPGLQTFPGDALTLNTNTELRAKQPGAILNFPGVRNAAGLILKGGVLNAGDDAVFVITGRIQVVSRSFIVPADNGGGAVKQGRGFNLAGRLSGSGPLVIYQAGTTVPQEISGNSNAYTGDILVKAGWLKGSGDGSLGTGYIVIDPNADVGTNGPVNLAEGPAWLEVDYDLVSPGKLTLQNGGLMILHQDCAFGQISIEGDTLRRGSYSYPLLAAAYPKNFAPGGSGSLTVTTGTTNFTTTVSQGDSEDWNAAIWQPGPVSPEPRSTYECLTNGIAFGAGLNNTRIRNPAASGLQTFPGDLLTLNTNTELRAKAAGAILNFPGTSTNAGLILKGGVLNAGDDAVFELTGKVQVASTSFIIPAEEGAGAIRPTRGFNISAQLSGKGTLVICQAGTEVAQEISGNSNTFTGDIVLKTGWLKGSGTNSLGTGNIKIDPLYPVGITGAASLNRGPAQFEVSYDIVTPGTLTLTNGGSMILHQDCRFGAVTIQGAVLAEGIHPYAELLSSFPRSFAQGGSGSLTVKPAVAPPAPTGLTVINGDKQVALTWQASTDATGYIVRRSLTSGKSYVAVASTAEASFTNTGLTNGTMYYYVVAATNSFGASTNSLEIAARPLAILGGVQANTVGGNITLNWTGAAALQEASDVTGPWTNVPLNVPGSYATPASEPRKFYRLMAP